MNKENYQILGVSEDATDEEIKESYRTLKKKYNEDRWKDGEEGAEALRMLDRLETAYEEVMTERREKSKNTDGANAFEEVAELIRKGDITGAQRKLDSFNERPAEWHYLQSVIFYRKNWMNESKKQLEIAMKMDPSNTKYRDAYDKLKARADYSRQTGGSPSASAQPQGNGADGKQMGGSWCANCATFCYTYLCINCLFSLCCNCR